MSRKRPCFTLSSQQRSLTRQRRLPYGAPTAAAPLVGVGGWLLFLILCLTIIGPLISLFNLIVILVNYNNVLFVPAGLSTMTTFAVILILASTGWSIFSGVSLWKFRLGAVRMTKLFLLIGFLLPTIVGCLLPYIFLPSSITAELSAAQTIWPMIPGAIFAIAWYLYLGQSRRVVATYPQG
jgi:hypothetical protein